MRIPEIREELAAIAKRIKVLTKELERRPSTRAPRASVSMTLALKAAIRAYKVKNPKATQVQIGQRFNVNPGRVSEALRGKRK